MTLEDTFDPKLAALHAAPEDEETGPDMLELLTPAARHWRSLVIVPIAAGALALGATYLVKPVFSSATSFLPPQQQQSSATAALASLGAVAGLATAAGLKSPADQYVALMQSNTVSDRLIDKFKLKDVYDVKFLDQARKALSKHAQVNAGKKDGLIIVDVEDTDPVRAAAIANQYVEELRRLTSVIAISEAQQRRMFFEKQLQDTKGRLVSAQVALQSSGFNAGAIKAEPKAAADTYARLRAQLTAAEVRLQTMRGSLADGNPEIQQQLAAVQALRGQVAELEKADDASAGTGAPDYVGKYREFKYQETLFDLLARQYELARVDESREGALIQVVDTAQPAERKSRPQRALIAVATTFLVGLGYALFLVMRERWRVAGADPEVALRRRRFAAAFRRD